MLENLNPYDIAVLAILVLSTFWGGMRGVITQIASIATWGGGWLIAARYHTVVLRYISDSVSETWRTPVAVIITFAVAAIAIGIGAAFVKRVFSLVGLKEFDRQAGAFCGLLKGAIFCMLITFFMVIVGGKGRDLVGESKSGPFFISLIDSIQDYFPESDLSRKFDEVITSMELKKEEKEENTFQTEVDELKSYLKNRVLSGSAADLVEEADAIEESEENNSGTSVFKSFASNFRRLGDEIGNAVKRAASGSKAEDEQVSNLGATFNDEYDASSSKSSDVYSSNKSTYQYDDRTDDPNSSLNDYPSSRRSNNRTYEPIKTSSVAYDEPGSTNYAQANERGTVRDTNELSTFLQTISNGSSGYQESSRSSYGQRSNVPDSTYGYYSNDVYEGTSGVDQRNASYNGVETPNDDSFNITSNSGEFGFADRSRGASMRNASSRIEYGAETDSRYSRNRRTNSQSASSRRLGTHSYTISSSNY